MASAFEAFVQLELPLRPFVQTDGAEETIPVRRGPGPRQMMFIELKDGEVLSKVDGVLRGVSVTLPQKYVHTNDTPANVWVITHNMNVVTPLVQVWDNSSQLVIPDSVTVIDSNTVNITFASQCTGIAVIRT